MTESNCNSSGTMIGFVLVWLSMVLVMKSSAEVDWCSPSLSCVVKDQVYQHTMCLYKNETGAPSCKNISNVQIYPGRFEMLKKHNQLREAVATGKVGQWPTASAMKKLSYDNVLEKIAYHWATQCSAGHDTCRKTKRWPVVGQNVFELARDVPIDYRMWNPASVVDDWFRDMYTINPANYSGEDTSFAQMVHDKTEKIGCADVQYEVIGNENRYRRLIVCNYGPGVQPGASQLYEEGATCSKCPSGVRCLCGARVLGHQDASTPEPDAGSTGGGSGDGSTDAGSTEMMSSMMPPDDNMTTDMSTETEMSSTMMPDEPTTEPRRDDSTTSETTTLAPGPGPAPGPGTSTTKPSTKGASTAAPSLAFLFLAVLNLKL